eukprot:COSAG01_NODE_4044_length_5408_cov_1.746468_5_plen_210_part_00
MTHDELVLEALAYRRNVGATLGEIRSYLQFREDTKHTQKQDRDALRRFEDDGHLVTVGKKWFFTSAGHQLAKGSALDAEWESADAWIFLAALYNRESDQFELQHIVAAADFINHAIPTLEELHGAINRSLAGRLIKTKRGAFSVTDKALELFTNIESSCKKSVLDQLDGLRRIMDCPCCGVKLKSVRWRFVLDAAAYKNAVDAYYKMVR